MRGNFQKRSPLVYIYKHHTHPLNALLTRRDQQQRQKTTTSSSRLMSSTHKKGARRDDDDGEVPNASSNTNKKQKKSSTNAKNEPLPDIIPQEALENDIFASDSAMFKGQKFTAVAFNVAGLRAMLKSKPQCLRMIVDKTQCDVLMFSEHKLNPENVEEATKQLKQFLPEFATVKFACSTAKKGYAGVCILARSGWTKTAKTEGGKSPMKQTSIKDMFGGVKKETEGTPSPTTATAYDGPKLLNVTEGLLDKKHLTEGRAITLEFDTFNAVFTYVPNSGEGLVRLGFRINTWEKECREHLNALQAKKPTIYGGDLNVAHLDIDIYNVNAKHIPKSSATTPQERNAFGVMMKECKMKDCFRYFNPTKSGWYTYWSQRVANRPKNRGLRLDYFLASDKMFEEDAKVKVVSSGILTEMKGSDHCPVYITLDVQK